MARLLLEKGAAANYIGVSPLAVAVQTGNLQMAKLLLEKGAMIDDVVSTKQRGYHAALACCGRRKIELMKTVAGGRAR